MGQTFSQYDPFTVHGQYNTNSYLYENKKNALIIISVILCILISYMIMLYTTNSTVETNGSKYDQFELTKYGYGPYGYGEYLMPKHKLAYAL